MWTLEQTSNIAIIEDILFIIASAFANHSLHDILFETVNSRQPALRNSVLSGHPVHRIRTLSYQANSSAFSHSLRHLIKMTANYVRMTGPQNRHVLQYSGC